MSTSRRRSCSVCSSPRCSLVSLAVAEVAVSVEGETNGLDNGDLDGVVAVFAIELCEGRLVAVVILPGDAVWAGVCSGIDGCLKGERNGLDSAADASSLRCLFAAGADMFFDDSDRIVYCHDSDDGIEGPVLSLRGGAMQCMMKEALSVFPALQLGLCRVPSIIQIFHKLKPMQIHLIYNPTRYPLPKLRITWSWKEPSVFVRLLEFVPCYCSGSRPLSLALLLLCSRSSCALCLVLRLGCSLVIQLSLLTVVN